MLSGETSTGKYPVEVVKTIEKNLYESLIFDEVEFTIYDNFPFASVKINNLLLKESQNFDNDTLLFTAVSYTHLTLPTKA